MAAQQQGKKDESDYSKVLGAIDPALQEINDKLRRARAAGWHVYAPEEIRSVPPFCRAVLEVVKLSPDPARGDVYAARGKLDIGRRGLVKIADAFGADWLGSERTDDGRDPEKCGYTVTAQVLGFDGKFKAIQGSYLFDVTARCDEMRAKAKRENLAKAAAQRKTEAEIDRKVAEERGALITHRGARAETGAVERVVAALGVKRGGYTEIELTLPFLIARLQVDVGNDQQAKEMLLRQAFKIAGELYPSERHAAPLPPPPDEGAALLDQLPTTRVASARSLAQPAAPQPSVTTSKPLTSTEFAAIEVEAQVAIIDLLAKVKGYQLSKLASTTVELSPRNRVRLYEHLLALADLALSDEMKF